jgi:SepF-like predicted cell division protein (DUF552 family)
MSEIITRAGATEVIVTPDNITIKADKIAIEKD